MASTTGKYDVPVDPLDLNSTYGLICSRIPAGSVVLDIGCGSGSLSRAVREHLNCSVVGIDIDERAVAVAKSRGVDALVADIVDVRLDSIVGSRKFDVVIFADVLEHMAHPERQLSAAASVLRPEGRVLVSIPNVTHVDVQVMLAQGEWRYQPTGLLDETHLRFFDLAGFRGLAFRSGYDVESVQRVTVPLLGTEVLSFGRDVRLHPADIESLRAISLSAAPDGTVYQYVFELRAAPERRGARYGTAPHGQRARPLWSRHPPQLDVILRTGEGRLDLLSAALQMLAKQSHAPVRAIVALPSPRPEYLGQVEEKLASNRSNVQTVVVTTNSAEGSNGAKVLNRALDVVSAEFLAICDDDDALYPDFAQRLLSHLVEQPELALAYGRTRMVQGEFVEDGFRRAAESGVLGEPFDRVRLFADNCIPINGCVVRVADLARSGIRFDETFSIGTEWAFLRDLGAIFEFLFVDEIVSESRHPGVGRLYPWPSSADVRTMRSSLRRASASLPVRLRADQVSALASAGADLASLRLAQRKMIASRSWKVTRPLRWLLRSNLPEAEYDE